MYEGKHYGEELILSMVAHAVREAPREAVGIVVERPDGSLRYEPLRNVLEPPASHEAFLVDTDESIRAWSRAERDGERVIAIVHSHPRGPASPSANDLQLDLRPYAALIVSLEWPVRGLRPWTIVAWRLATPR